VLDQGNVLVEQNAADQIASVSSAAKGKCAAALIIRPRDSLIDDQSGCHRNYPGAGGSSPKSWPAGAVQPLEGSIGDANPGLAYHIGIGQAGP
jgi:hypothetical protein